MLNPGDNETKELMAAAANVVEQLWEIIDPKWLGESSNPEHTKAIQAAMKWHSDWQAWTATMQSESKPGKAEG